MYHQGDPVTQHGHTVTVVFGPWLVLDHDLPTVILVTWSAIGSHVTHFDWLSEVM